MTINFGSEWASNESDMPNGSEYVLLVLCSNNNVFSFHNFAIAASHKMQQIVSIIRASL